MAELTSSQKLVAVKAFARGNNIPLDASSVFDSKALAETYASSDPTAYAGQVICALEDGKPVVYALQAEDTGFSLVPAGLSDSGILDIINSASPEWGEIS